MRNRRAAGLIDETPESIEAERLKLDEIKSGRLPNKKPQASLDRFADRIRGDDPSLDDFSGRLLRKMDDAESYPVQHHAISARVVEHRGIRRSA